MLCDSNYRYFTLIALLPFFLSTASGAGCTDVPCHECFHEDHFWGCHYCPSNGQCNSLMSVTKGCPDTGGYVDYERDCPGCDGVRGSNLVLDECGVCGGDSTSCCSDRGTMQSTKVCVCDEGFCGDACQAFVDLCGECNGNGTSCCSYNGKYSGESCLCFAGYCGSNCSEAFDGCGICGGNGMSCCNEHGVAISSESGVSCACSADYCGSVCDKTIDFCGQFLLYYLQKLNLFFTLCSFTTIWCRHLWRGW
mmetsp:Transcript_15268/g.38552  ORF Transcript_15268/g.38552 Transcript_15268/m.38552 type:complete len:251 (-) Transcript_15268:2675-3427(-)